MTHVNFTTSGVALTDNQIARIREIIKDIAERLCSPSELKRKTSRNGGGLKPSQDETWLQAQGRALAQAWRLLRLTALIVYKE